MAATVAVAVREANPRTVKGLAVQGAAVVGMSAVSAGWRHRAVLSQGLTPVLATCTAAATTVVWPGQTALGFGAATVAGLIAGRAATARAAAARRPDSMRADGTRGVGAGGWSGVWTSGELRASGLARWGLGGLAWVGIGAVGGHEALAWWQDGALLAGLAVPGAATWWRAGWAPPVLAEAPVVRPSVLPPPAHVLQSVLTSMMAVDENGRGGWLAGGRVVQVLSPAPGVAVALVALPHGMHSATAAVEPARLALEAMLSTAGLSVRVPGGVLGGLDAGSVQLEPADVTHVRVSASWSKALDEGALPWRPPAELAPSPGHATGQVWLGHDDARQDLVAPSWYVGDDGKTSVVHAWIIGRTGGGKSTTIRVYSGTGLVSGLEALILLDGKGDSLSDLAPWSLTGSVARDPDSWRQGIALAYAIMVSRQQRLGTPDEWRGPTPDDPIITLEIDECATVAAGLTRDEVRMICEMGRLGRSLGVRTIQSGQIPLVDSVIGGSEWRSQARLVIAHGVQDKIHNHVATQSDGSGGVSLLGLPIGRAVAIFDGEVLARRAKITMMTEADLQNAAGYRKPTLSPLDRTPVVEALLELATGWANSRPQAVVDLGGLLSQWTDLPSPSGASGSGGSGGPAHANPYVDHTTIGHTIDLTAIEAAAGTVSEPPSVIPAPRPPAAAGRSDRRDDRHDDRRDDRRDDRDELRQWLLSHLLVHPGLTRASLVRAAEAAGWSRSGAYKAVGAAIDTGAVIDDGDTLTPAALWQG